MRVYIASLSDYNNGRLEGKWFDLSDYLSASDLMDDIQEMLNDLTKKYKNVDGEVREEWAVHDYEGIPPTLASEYMSEADFEKLIEIRRVAEDRDIPVEVLVERAGDTGSDDYEALADSLVMVVDGYDETNIVYELEDQLGDLGYDFWQDYIFITATDQRLLYGEDVDRFREDILYENPDRDEEEAERQAEEMADEEESRRNNDLVGYIEELGYEGELPNWVAKDYNDAWKYALSYDYDVIHHDDQMYVFTNNYSVGGTILSGLVGAYIGYKIGRAKPQKKGFETEKKIGRKIKGAFSKKKFANGGGVDEEFYVGQTIKIDEDNNPYGKMTKDIKKIITPYLNKELVIEEITIKKPHNIAKAYLKSSGEKVPFDIVLNKKYIQTFAGGGGVYSSDSMYELKVFDGKSNELLTTKRFRARNQREAKELGQDYEYEMQQKYGDYLRFEVSEAKPLMARGGGIGFKGLSAKVAKRYEGKKPEAKYRAEYGKRYSKSEAKEVGDKVAGKVYWQQKGRKMAEGGKILQEISTHKAVKKGDKIYIYIKGMPIENAEDKRLAKKYPHWFKDELIRTIPAENEDDLFYIFENYEEENRINLSGYARGGNVNTGRSWHLDRARHNKRESYEKPLTNRKHKYEDGGQIGQEIVFDDNGEENTGVIKDITNLGDYVVKADDGRTLLAQRDLDVISLGDMRSASTEAPRKRFGFFEDGGGVEYPNHYLEFEDLKRKINALEQQIQADYRNDDIDSYTHRNEMELERLEQKLELLMLGKDSYSEGGGVESITPALNEKVMKRSLEIYHKNGGKTIGDFVEANNKAIEEFGYNPQQYHKIMSEIGSEYEDDDYFAKGGGVSGLDDLIRG